jgi:hypothetical protein
MCTCVQILTSNTVLVKTRQNRRYITKPAEYKGTSCSSTCVMVCVIIYSAKMQVKSAKNITLHSPNLPK